MSWVRIVDTRKIILLWACISDFEGPSYMPHTRAITSKAVASLRFGSFFWTRCSYFVGFFLGLPNISFIIHKMKKLLCTSMHTALAKSHHRCPFMISNQFALIQVLGISEGVPQPNSYFHVFCLFVKTVVWEPVWCLSLYSLFPVFFGTLPKFYKVYLYFNYICILIIFVLVF